eukprot:1140086-Pelagomonas_calceolata.AAC.2
MRNLLEAVENSLGPTQGIPILKTLLIAVESWLGPAQGIQIPKVGHGKNGEWPCLRVGWALPGQVLVPERSDMSESPCKRKEGDGSVASWGSLDDVVMGGVSSSSISSVPGAGENGQPAMVFRWVRLKCRRDALKCSRDALECSRDALKCWRDTLTYVSKGFGGFSGNTLCSGRSAKQGSLGFQKGGRLGCAMGCFGVWSSV